MPRKSTKNTMSINDAINTPLNFQFDETAEKLGIGEPALRERLEAKLDNADVHTWGTIPYEYQPLIDAIARDLESEASVRRITPQEETPQLPVQPEIPEVPDEPKDSIVPHNSTNQLAANINQETIETHELKQEALQAIDLLFSAEEDEKAQIAAAVKQHGWNVYERLGADLDTAKILEIAQEKLANADSITNSRLASAKERLGLKTIAQRKAELEAMKNSFLQQSQRRTKAWGEATSLKSND